MTTERATVKGQAARSRHTSGVMPGWVRALVLALLLALTVPAFMALGTPSASAAEVDCSKDENEAKCRDYSLYKLSSNAASYFGNQNAPDAEGGETSLQDPNSEWSAVTKWPAAAGSLLGYADGDSSLSLNWIISNLSGSSQTLSYSSLVSSDGSDKYKGLLNYAYFGAANADLGLDSMNGSVVSGMLNPVSGGIIWLLYLLAVAVSAMFGFVIALLKLLNPFMWFGSAVKAISPTFAEGMTGGGTLPPALAGVGNFISSWYGTLQDISWTVLIPIFMAVLMLSLLLFKKLDKGSAIKKLVVRMTFIGLGLPLLGSMYTGVLNKFDDVGGNLAGPSGVVLSTYVDFESWMMKYRLAVPADADITWSPFRESADSSSVISVRSTALAINRQNNSIIASNTTKPTATTNAVDAWKQNQVSVNSGETSTSLFSTTIGMLNNYISGTTVAASDFEASVKSNITELDSPNKAKWFVNAGGDGGYGSADKFGEGTESGSVGPLSNPIITPGGSRDANGAGLWAENLVGEGEATNERVPRKFSSGPTPVRCNSNVLKANSEEVQPCNLSVLSGFNYLNTNFDKSAMTIYSSNKATSGFSRELHNSVTQVGTGMSKVMYWANAAVTLGCLVILGFWYAIGLLAASLKRTISVVAAIPFATLGAMASISKVIIYSVALVMEVLVTLFIYQFVSSIMTNLPDIIAGPMAVLLQSNGFWGSSAVGLVVVVFITLVTMLVMIGVTFALLGARKSVMKAMDEAVTKLVDKFLDTNTAPSGGGGGMLPALASGVGSGVGMAAGNKLAKGLGGKSSEGGDRSKLGAATNAGGTNTDLMERANGMGEIGEGPDGRELPDGGNPQPGGGGVGSSPAALEPGAEERAGSTNSSDSLETKKTAQSVAMKGGLSKLGVADSKGMTRGVAALGSGSGSGTVAGVAAGYAGVAGTRRNGAISVPGSGAQLPTREEGIAAAGGQGRVNEMARINGISPREFEQRYMGPFRSPAPVAGSRPTVGTGIQQAGVAADAAATVDNGAATPAVPVIGAPGTSGVVPVRGTTAVPLSVPPSVPAGSQQANGQAAAAPVVVPGTTRQVPQAPVNVPAAPRASQQGVPAGIPQVNGHASAAPVVVPGTNRRAPQAPVNVPVAPQQGAPAGNLQANGQAAAAPVVVPGTTRQAPQAPVNVPAAPRANGAVRPAASVAGRTPAPVIVNDNAGTQGQASVVPVAAPVPPAGRQAPAARGASAATPQVTPVRVQGQAPAPTTRQAAPSNVAGVPRQPAQRSSTPAAARPRVVNVQGQQAPAAPASTAANGQRTAPSAVAPARGTSRSNPAPVVVTQGRNTVPQAAPVTPARTQRTVNTVQPTQAAPTAPQRVVVNTTGQAQSPAPRPAQPAPVPGVGQGRTPNLPAAPRSGNAPVVVNRTTAQPASTPVQPVTRPAAPVISGASPLRTTAGEQPKRRFGRRRRNNNQDNPDS